MNTNTKKLIDSGSQVGIYDMTFKDAIVDDSRFGRLYISQRFGGMDTIDGGAYRWGMVMKVDANATLAEARTIDPRSPESEILDWDGAAVANYMKSVTNAFFVIVEKTAKGWVARHGHSFKTIEEAKQHIELAVPLHITARVSTKLPAEVGGGFTVLDESCLVA